MIRIPDQVRFFYIRKQRSIIYLNSIRPFVVFSIFDPQNIAYSQHYTGYLLLNYIIDLRYLNFLTNINKITNVILNLIFRLNGTTSTNDVCAKYDTVNMEIISVKKSIWKSFIQVNKLY